MLTLKRVLGVAGASLLAAGLAVAADMPGLGGPPAPTTPAAPPGDGTIQLQIVKNGEDGYQLGYPVGWGIITGGDSDYTFGPTDGSLKGQCFADGTSKPDLPDDATIKPILSSPIGEDNWKTFMFDGFQDLKFVSTAAQPDHPGGWPVQQAIVTGTISGTPVEIAAQMTFKAKTSFVVVCIMAQPDFEKATPFMKAIFQSFKVTK